LGDFAVGKGRIVTAEATMIRHLARVGMGVLIAAGILLGLGSGAWGQATGGKFVAPDVAAAGDISYPPNTTTTGMVSLLVTVDEGGKAAQTQVLQDVPPLTAAAQAGVGQWTFQAAHANGKTVAARLPVHVVFNPYNPGGTAVSAGGPTVPPAVPSNLTNFMPPQVRMASYAFYPTNTQAQGTVVLSVSVDKSGHVAKMKVVRGVAGLNDAAMEAVKQWGFQPAMRDGATEAGRLCVAFVFQRNLS
jgi:TonB family protein